MENERQVQTAQVWSLSSTVPAAERNTPFSQDDAIPSIPTNTEGISAFSILSTGGSLKAELPEAPEAFPNNSSFKDLLSHFISFCNGTSAPVLMAISLLCASLSVLVLGRLGILVIGVCTGILGYATLQGQSTMLHSQRIGHISYDIADQLQYAGSYNPKSARDDDPRGDAEPSLDLSFLPPLTATALSELIRAIVRDYVRYWYSPLVPTDSNFPASCHDFLTDTVAKLSAHISSKRPADLFLTMFYSSSNNMIILFRELAIIAASNPSLTIADYVASRPDSALADLTDRKHQDRRLHMAAKDLVEICLSKEARRCDPLATFFQEILKGVVFESMVEKFSEPEWINGWIVYLLEDEGQGTPGSSKEGVGGLLLELDRGVIGAASSKKSDIVQATKGDTIDGKNKRLSKADDDMEQAMREAEELSRMIAEAESVTTEQKELDEQEVTYASLNPALNQTMVSGKSASVIKTLEMSVKDPHDSPRDPYVACVSQTSQIFPTPESRADPTAENEIPDVAESISSGRTYVGDDYADEDEQVYQAYRASPKASGHGSKNYARPHLSSQQETLSYPPLLNARITITDLGPQSNPPKVLKSRPTQPYMLQVEPLKNSGWITMRKYSDFEALHEVLKRIAAVSGAQRFLLAYAEDGLPTWKGRAFDEVGANLELYLRIVLDEPRLIECDAFKRFMERNEERLAKERPNAEGSLPTFVPSWPNTSAFKNMGEGVLGALTKAPQSATEGSKALFGNVLNAVQGGVGLKRASTNLPNGTPVDLANSSSKPTLNAILGSKARGSVDSFANIIGLGGGGGGGGEGGGSLPSSRAQSTHRDPSLSQIQVPVTNNHTRDGSNIDQDRGRPGYPWPQDENRPLLPARPSDRGHGRTTSIPQSREQSTGVLLHQAKSISINITKNLAQNSRFSSPQSHKSDALKESEWDSRPRDAQSLDIDPVATISLPPLPSEIDENYASVSNSVHDLRSEHSPQSITFDTILPPTISEQSHLALTEPETQFAIDMFFSVITELYNLSSVWMLRRSLLNIAKSVLLRPGNASLKSIREVLQESILNANTKDEVLAHHIRSLRHNALPSESEIKQWEDEGPLTPMPDCVKMELRAKARKMVGNNGLPEGLRGLMGGQASREAMEAVFDCLQRKEVARGLIAILLADVVRGLCH